MVEALAECNFVHSAKILVALVIDRDQKQVKIVLVERINSILCRTLVKSVMAKVCLYPENGLDTFFGCDPMKLAMAGQRAVVSNCQRWHSDSDRSVNIFRYGRGAVHGAIV